MTFLRRSGNGHWYIARRDNTKRLKNYKNWFIVKCCGNGTNYYIPLKMLSVPKQFFGKKLRFKLEVIEDDKNKQVRK